MPAHLFLHTQTAVLAFFTLALFAARPEQGAVTIEPDDFLVSLREDLLPADMDLNPGLEAFADFVSDCVVDVCL